MKSVLAKVGLWKQIGSHTNKFWNVKCCSIFHFFSLNTWTHQVTATSKWTLSGSIYVLVLRDWLYITTCKEWLIFAIETSSSQCYYIVKLHKKNLLRCDTVTTVVTCVWWRSQDEVWNCRVICGGKKKVLYGWWNFVNVQQILWHYISTPSYI